MDNIVLSGGSSMFPGFPERMCLELNALFHSTGCKIQVLASQERGTAAWGEDSMAHVSHILPARMDGKGRVPGVQYMYKIFQSADDDHAFKPSHWRGTAPAAGAVSPKHCLAPGRAAAAVVTEGQLLCCCRSAKLIQTRQKK